MALDFKAAALRAFQAKLALWPAVITYRGVDYPALAFPKEQSKKMTPSSYEEQLPSNFQILDSDLAKSGITLRAVIQYQGKNHEVYAISSDPSDPAVELRTYLKQ